MLSDTQAEYGILPKKKGDLIEALDTFVRASSNHYSSSYLMMTLYYLYLSGVRDFQYIDFRQGRIHYNHIDFADGRLQYQHMDIVKRFDDLHSRLMDLDFNPLVRATQLGLRPARERAAAQVIADALSHSKGTEEMKESLNRMFLLYGSAGLMGHLEDHPVIGMGADYEVVSPWEVLPFPMQGMSQGKERGIMRRRMVSLEYVKSLHSAAAVNRNFKLMDAWVVQHGFQPSVSDIAAMSVIDTGNLTSGGVAIRRPNSKGESENKHTLVEMRQLWIYGPQGTVARYIEQFGGWIAKDVNTEGEIVYCPLQFGRFKEDGTFYGKGVVGLAMGIHQQIEAMYSRLFDFVRDLDRFGMLLFPQGTVDQSQFIESPHGMKIGFYEPDIAGGANVRPMQVVPNTPGPFPGQVAATGTGILNQLLPTPAILQGDAPGRVDSTSGLMFLNQQANAALATSSKTLARMKGEVDRVLVNSYSKRVREAGGKDFIPITRMDLSLIGSVITGASPDSTQAIGVSFSDNPIPIVAKLNFSIREVEPRMKVARKREVIEEAQAGRLDPLDFALINIQEDLGIPMKSEQIEYSLRTATINALMLFNDGVKPGKMIDSDYGPRADVVAKVIDEVMAMPEFLLASAEVQEEFVQWKQDVYAQMGQPLPGSTPPVDELAAILDSVTPAADQLKQATQNVLGA